MKTEIYLKINKTFSYIQIAVILLFVVCSKSVSAQALETWTSAGLGYKIGKLGLSADYQVRHEFDPTTLEKHFGELGANYTIWKDLRLGTVLRLGEDRKKSGFVSFNRIALYSQYNFKIGRLNVKPRVQWQHQTTQREDEVEELDKLRLKVSTKYNIKKWKLDPRLSAEFFSRDSNSDGYFSEKVRLTLGTQYEVINNLHLKLGYRYELPIASSADRRQMIVTSLSYDLGGAFEKKD